MGYSRIAIESMGWQGLQKLLMRLVGYLRIAVLARALTPSQFGVFGIGAFVLAFLEILTETGINIFLIQRKEGLKDHINTAWVVSIIRGVVISLAMLTSATFISRFFDNSDSFRLLVVFSIVPFLRGFINPSIVKFKKELEYRKEFLLRFSVFFIDAVVAIFTALMFQSELSIVYGLIAGVVFEVIFSFLFVSPRPKLQIDLVKVRQILSQGRWVNLGGLFDFFNTQGDDVVVARMLNTFSLGVYQNAYKISTLPLTEISNAVTIVVFPVYSKFANDTVRLKRAFLKTMLFTTIAVIPFGIVFYTFPEVIVSILLGDQWTAAASVLKVLSVYGVLSALVSVPNSVFYAREKQKIVAKLKLVELVVIAFGIFPLVGKFGILGAAYAVIIGVLAVIPFTFYFLRREFAC